MNLLWFQDQAKTTNKMLIYPTAIVFLLGWAVFRLGFCAFGCKYMIDNFRAAYDLVPACSFWYCIICIPLLMALNTFWFYKILRKFFYVKPTEIHKIVS